MKSRLIWAAVLIAAMAGFYYMTIRPANNSGPSFTRKRSPLNHLRPAEIPPPPLPEPVVTMPEIPPPVLNQPLNVPAVATRRESRTPTPVEVPIQPGATIDFSIGAPVVRSGGKDDEALDRALKEMAEAAKDVTFPPTKKK